MSSDRTRRSLSRSSRSSRGSLGKQPAASDEPDQKLVESSPTIVSASSVNIVSDGIRKITLSPPRERGPRAHGVIVVGPAG
jgi:hypothetical protein